MDGGKLNRIALIPTAKIPECWPMIEERIAAACMYNGGRYGSDDCLEELKSNQKQLWIVHEGSGIVITQLIDFPRMRSCSIDVCTGNNLDAWSNLLGVIENWARAQGCAQMFLIARPGMEKLLKAHGYVKTHTVFEKELGEIH